MGFQRYSASSPKETSEKKKMLSSVNLDLLKKGSLRETGREDWDLIVSQERGREREGFCPGSKEGQEVEIDVFSFWGYQSNQK
jgi:hypothetical protein